MSNGINTNFEVSPTTLVRALTHLNPMVSALIVGDHGIGKSDIVRQVAENLRIKHPEHNWPLFDRRLAQMTEGDMVGVPHVKFMDEHGVTAFLPVDWVKQACDEPCVVLLDELNRAEPQITNSAFQFVGAREMNGMKLHPLTRVISAINPPTHYQVNEIDKALLDRFVTFFLKSEVADWLAWARSSDLDETLIDFIQENPTYLTHDISKTGDLEVGPTPRSWHKLNDQLVHAEISPSDVQGRAAPDLFAVYCHGLVGTAASIQFLKWLRDRETHLTVEDVLDNWGEKRVKKLCRRLRHEELLSCVARIGEHSKKNSWTEEQSKRLVDWALDTLSGEDRVLLFSSVTKSGNIENIMKIHNTKLTDQVVDRCNEAKAFGDKR